MKTTSFLNEVCNNCKILDLKQLCICVDKLVWVLSCDIYCLNYDGSILDACLIALLSALQTGNFLIIWYKYSLELMLILHFSCSRTYVVFDKNK